MMKAIALLSGGLDSSILAALAARHAPKIATFSMGFASMDPDESGYARLVAERMGTTHHHFIFDETRFSDLLPVVAAALGEPVGDQALLPVYWLCKEARKHVTVALSGEGADELFGGYSYYGRFANRGSLREVLRKFLRRDRGEGKTGILIPPRDAAALAGALASLLDSPLKAREMGRLGRERAMKVFDEERMADSICSLYEHMLGRATKSPWTALPPADFF